MAFRDVRLPEDIEREFTGGPVWNVTVVEVASGYEQRNLNASAPRAKWSATLPLTSEAEKMDMLSFWNCVRGPTDSWRFRDWSDYYAGMSWIINDGGFEELVHSDGDSNPVIPEQFGVSDGTTTTEYQLKKTYVYGSLSHVRDITKPVSAIKIWVETGVGTGVYAERTSNVTVDYATGTVIFPSSAPASDLKLAWSGKFDVPVRFQLAEPNFTFSYANLGSFPVSVIEVRE